MSQPYSHLLSPIQRGKFILKNRMQSSNSLPHFSQGPEKYPADATIAHFLGRAKSGAAFITLAGFEDSINAPQFPDQQAPWVGWFMIIGRDSVSERSVRNYEPYFPTRPEFKGATYIDRYRILCQKLMLERHYTSTALMWTSSADVYGDVSADVSIITFLSAFAGYLIGVANEFK